MADSDWTGYVGVVTGVVGMVTGCLAYWRSNRIKALDLRLELRKGLGDAHHALSTLRERLDFADRSRRAVLAATGLLRSGNIVVWERAVAADREQANTLGSSIRSETADFTALSTEQLESEIVAAHKIRTRLDALITKYRGEISADDESRRRIAQEAADRVNRAGGA